MTLSSVKYLVFLAAVAAVYFLLPKKYRTGFLLLASYGFYASWQPLFCLLLLAATALSWLCAAAAERRFLGQGRLWTVLGALGLFGMLFLYKYLDFFMNSLLQLVGRPASFRSGLLLPIGISFYTFSAAAYLFDTAAGKLEPERSFFRYALYVAFFPAILSGPINRPAQLLPQIRQPRDFSYGALKRGLLRFAVGAVKKTVVANTLGQLADGVYGSFETCSGALLALTAMAFFLQIYFDFSGYTDMALGSAEVLGYELPENFRAPLLASSVKDFWRRWHISLTSWLRDYIFFPLGGSRCPKWRTCLNILIVFGVSGLWHGAGATFLIWGLLNGCYQVVELLFSRRKGRPAAEASKSRGWRSAFGWAATFLLLSLSAVFFRAESASLALAFLARIPAAFLPREGMLVLHDFMGYRQLALGLLCLLFFWLDDLRSERRGRGLLQGLENRALPYWLTLAGIALFVAVFGIYGAGFNAGSFVYFQF